MEPRAQLPIKIILIVMFIVCGVVSGCSGNKQTVPSTGYITVNSDDVKLMHQGGMVYYDNMLLTGKVADLYENSDTSKITDYTGGRENGKQLLFYKGRKQKEERFYANGWKEGVHSGWWENGNKKFIYNFKNDVYEGNQRDFNESGMLFNDFNYSNGHEEGLQRSWYATGILRANYVVKNGRKYGLTGVKNCQTVYEK